jgi:hypothetical protein
MRRLLVGNEKRLTHLFPLGGHHDCILSNQRPGMAGAPNQSSIHSLTRSLDSHHHLRHWLLPRELFANSFREPGEIFTVPVHVLLSGSLFFLQIFTSFLQFIGEHYSAHGQDQIIFFGTNG